MIIEIVLGIVCFGELVAGVFLFVKKIKDDAKHVLEVRDLNDLHEKALEDKQEENIKTYERLLNRIEEADKAYKESIDEYQKELDAFSQFHAELFTRLNSTIDYMREIDLRGSFESDDEVGATFKDMLTAIESLKPYLDVLETNGNTEEKTQEEGSQKQQ